MAFIADLHIHSRFARACSGQLNVPNLVEWSKLKGIDLLGTGDCLHPLWLTELKSQLKEDGSGFLTYEKDPSVKMVLTVEISSIYSHKGAVRRVHNIIVLPSFESAQRFQQALLSKRSNLSSDGRPTVGIPSKELLYMVLEADPKALFIPAHAWTPWFGIFGSKSGYNSLSDCFEDLVDKVYAVETGLSSDPAMNWRIKELDNKSIISCSDAHSLPNLAREATVFSGSLEAEYKGFYQAIKEQGIAGTIEFYPEEGKYHFTGHRDCGVKYSPQESKQKGTKCPVCGRELTVGVMERVEELANRSEEELRIVNSDGMIKSTPLQRPGYKMLVPLLQIIAESLGLATSSQRVVGEYRKLIAASGNEVRVLTKVDLDEIASVAGPKIAEGVGKARKGDLVIDPGFDGVYGVVKIWNESKVEGEDENSEQPQLGLFD